ncbi:exostosin-like 1 isoform X3 [Numida meleagris]|uniref:exostosin-like 1 isoform X3 n=1 Tax=Numida meleagris TaxID=8996 RepID=UPI000B3DD319|nr:exostosin-like 1 isoform X3 [Numida meleagris]
MQTRKKYIFLTFLAFWLLLFFFGGEQLRRFAFFPRRNAPARRSWPRWADRTLLPSFAEPRELQGDEDAAQPSPRARRAARLSTSQGSRCRMESCFDASRCREHGFKVFTYPRERGEPVSESYGKILASIESSRYYTPRPEEACLFVLGIDTLDRDPLSAHYVRSVEQKIRAFPLWNSGRNHLIFNLYAGTWPNYTEELGFDIGHAMLAKASFYSENFRPGFDVSIPLFPREHPQRGGQSGWLHRDSVPPKKKYLLVFKGKRYLTGIGSGTRNALHHIHNGRDIVSLTTCRHGKDWERHKDTRCDQDNMDYERFDYQELLHNSTFCIVPRGRRLGSFRFLEALQAACIPVLLSDGWELPFSEAIDWGKAAVVGSERLLLQIPSAIRCIRPERVLAFQQQTQFLWDAYFSSVDKIVHTTLEIIRDRLLPHRSRSRVLWNTLPGGLLALPDFSTHLGDFPFYYLQHGRTPHLSVRHVPGACPHMSPFPPHRRLQPYRQVHGTAPGCPPARLPVPAHRQAHPGRLQVPVLRADPGAVELREATTTAWDVAADHCASDHHPGQDEAIRTDAVLSLDEDTSLSTSEVDFAFVVWRSFPERIVGFSAWSHFWDPEQKRWGYTSRWTNKLSIVLTTAAFYHRYYHSLFTEYLPAGLRELVDSLAACEDILMNLLVAAVTKLPPIKVTQWKQHKEAASQPEKGTAAGGTRRFSQQQDCLNQLADWFGSMPLVSSQLRLDPVLFKDQVSVLRKKYRHLEKP